MNPEGSVFFKGEKRILTCTYYLQLTHFVRHVQGIKLGTRTHTYTHAFHTISNDERENLQKKKRTDDVACCTRKTKKRDPKHTRMHT